MFSNTEFNLYRQENQECEREELYCKLFTMAHCFISLKLAKRFEKGGQVKLEPICIKGKTKENQNNDNAKINKDQGQYFVQYMKLFEV